MDHPLILKVKCDKVLRRITAYVSNEGILNLDLDRLRRKVQFLFHISPNADFKLRYIDEDGDEISLFEDGDLREAITQRLNPLRITVVLNNVNETRSESSSSRSKSAQVEHASSCMDNANADVLKSSERCVDEILSKFSNELVERLASLVLNKLIEDLPKLAISCTDVVYKHQDGENASSRSSTTACSTLAKPSSHLHLTETKSPQLVQDKLNLRVRGDCPTYSTVLVSQAFIREFYSCQFVCDLSVADHTCFTPNITCIKKWRLCNSGIRAWPHNSKLVWIGGDKLSDEISVEIEIPVNGLPVGKELDVAVNFKAPELPGHYVSYWKMSLPTGETFGERIWVLIQVSDPLKYLKQLDLNFPPPGCVDDDEDIRYMTTRSIDLGCSEFADEAKKSFPTLMECKVNGLHTNSHAANICSRLPKPNGGSSGAQLESVSDCEDNDLEHSLLKVLEQMGFKLTYLNKEILKLNSYNLQETLSDLGGIHDWDQILAELENTGYSKKGTDMYTDMTRKNMKKFANDVVSGKIAAFKANTRLRNHNYNVAE